MHVALCGFFSIEIKQNIKQKISVLGEVLNVSTYVEHVESHFVVCWFGLCNSFSLCLNFFIPHLTLPVYM